MNTLTAAPPRWTVRGTPRPGAPRLYCFPHGGGSAAEYVRMARDLPGVELHAIQLPGRGTRLRESSFTRMSELVETLVEEIPFGTEPFAFFGHSLGALVAYEVTRRLRRTGRRLPDRLLLSGYPAPSIPRVADSVRHLADDDLLAEVNRRHGGMPAEVTADPELRALVAGSLRADYEVLETYRWQADEALPVPITLFGGRDDAVTKEALAAWRRHTTNDVTVRQFPGGHFYFRERRSPLPRFLAGAVRGLGRGE
jgi:surfactin synthase thioesterase subunit